LNLEYSQNIQNVNLLEDLSFFKILITPEYSQNLRNVELLEGLTFFKNIERIMLTVYYKI